jgi:hypothetical protein
MKLKSALSAIGLLLASAVVAAEKSECLDVGSAVGAFTVTDVTGPSAGKALCYRCQFKDRPVVSIFARQINDELATLVKHVDEVVGKHQSEKMAAFVVLLSDDPQAQEPKLKQLASKHGIKNTPLTTFDDKNGPPSYKLSQNADFTVMMWVNGELKVNETFTTGQLSEQSISKVVEKTSTILN